jgi:methionyl aminopeptidase
MIYKQKEIEILREGGRRLAYILNEIKNVIVSGIITKKLDDIAKQLIKDGGDDPAFLGYTPGGASSSYPASICVSVNDEIVHGIPGKRVLKEGDIVGIDLGLKHKGLFVDAALTVPVGKVDQSSKELIFETQKALYAGIDAARGGGHIGDIGAAIEKSVKKSGFSIVEELGGHGVGHKVHQDPFIPNVGKRGTGGKIVSGMVIAIEPMLNEGSKNISLSLKDNFTFSTMDGKRSAHFEHTILITDGAPEILTKLPTI